MSENSIETPDAHAQDNAMGSMAKRLEDYEKELGRVSATHSPHSSTATAIGNSFEAQRGSDSFGQLSPQRQLSPQVGSVEVPPSPSTIVVSQTLDRRVDWLREDLEVVKRRVLDTLGPEVSSPQSKTKNGGAARLHSLANQLLGELAEEREWRENLEAELSSIETSLLQERAHREKALETLSLELKETMKSLVRRIDTGLVNGTQELNSRAAKTEVGLKALIQRVDEGLVIGSKFLQETLGGSDLLEVCSNSSKATASSNSGLTSASALDSSKEVAPPLLKMWGELQEENLRLRQKRVQLEARQLRSRLNSRSPTASTSHAASPLGPSSRNRSPAGGRQHPMNLGTGFRFDRSGLKKECQSPPENSPVHSTISRMEAGSLVVVGSTDDRQTPSMLSDLMRDVDTMSTTSSSLPNTKTSDDGRMEPRQQARPTPQTRSFIGDVRVNQRRGSGGGGTHSPLGVGVQPNGGYVRTSPGTLPGTGTGRQSPTGSALARSPQPVLQVSRVSNVQGTTPSVSVPSLGANATTSHQRSTVNDRTRSVQIQGRSGIRSGND